MIIDKLVALLGYELDDKSDAERVKYERGLDGMSEGIERAGQLAAKTAVFVGALTAGIGALVNQSTAATDALGKFAEANDISFKKLQQLNFAAGIFGGTNETVEASLRSVTEKLGEFQRGAGDLELLAQLGVSVQGVDSLEFIERLSDRFQGISATRAQDLGRKLGIDENFVQLLRQGSAEMQSLFNEAEALGILQGEDAPKNAAEFVDSQFRLREVIRSVKDQLVNGLVPAWTEATDGITAFLVENRAVITSGLEDFLQVVLKFSGFLVNAITFLGQVFHRLVLAVGSTERALYLLLGAYAALKVLGLTTLLQLLTGTKKLSLAMLLLNARALLIPVLIGAAVAAALIVLDDFFTFLRGGDSVIGDVVEAFTEWKNEFKEINGLAEALVSLLESVGLGFKTVGESIGKNAGRAVSLIKGGAEGEFARKEIAQTSANVSGFALDVLSGGETTRNRAEREANGGVPVETVVQRITRIRREKAEAEANFSRTQTGVRGGGVSDTTTTVNSNGSAEINVNVFGTNDPQTVGRTVADQTNATLGAFNVVNRVGQ